MDLRKLGCLLFFLGFVLYSVSYMLPLLSVTYTYVAFPFLEATVSKNQSGRGPGSGHDSSGNKQYGTTPPIYRPSRKHQNDLSLDSDEITKSKDGHVALTKIPKTIHHVLLGDDVDMRPEWEEAMASCRELHPDWRFVLWDDAKANAFVESQYPDLFEAYIDYTYDIQRSNILRYLILHSHGGIYLDPDMKCQSRLDAYLPAPSGFLYPATTADPERINAALMARSGHEFLEFVLGKLRAANWRWEREDMTNMFSRDCQLLPSMYTLFPDKSKLAVLEDDLLFHHIPPPDHTPWTTHTASILSTFLDLLKASLAESITAVYLLAVIVVGMMVVVVMLIRSRRGGGSGGGGSPRIVVTMHERGWRGYANGHARRDSNAYYPGGR